MLTYRKKKKKKDSQFFLALMSAIYEEHKDEDGFLYIT